MKHLDLKIHLLIFVCNPYERQNVESQGLGWKRGSPNSAINVGISQLTSVYDRLVREMNQFVQCTQNNLPVM